MDKRARFPQTETKKWASWTAVLAALILIFSLLASLVHTGFGTVTVRDIQYLTGEGGLQRSSLHSGFRHPAISRTSHCCLSRL